MRVHMLLALVTLVGCSGCHAHPYTDSRGEGIPTAIRKQTEVEAFRDSLDEIKDGSPRPQAEAAAVVPEVLASYESEAAAMKRVFARQKVYAVKPQMLSAKKLEAILKLQPAAGLY